MDQIWELTVRHSLVKVWDGKPTWTQHNGTNVEKPQAQDEAEVIRLANQTKYGLAGAIFTKDRHKARPMGPEILRIHGTVDGSEIHKINQLVGW